MSRFTHSLKEKPHIVVSYGYDSMPYGGYFIQVFDKSLNEDAAEISIIDLDTREDMSEYVSSRADIILAMKAYEVPKAHLEDIQNKRHFRFGNLLELESAIEWGFNYDEIVFGELTDKELLDEYKNHMLTQKDNKVSP